jgi:hypothetical protein
MLERAGQSRRLDRQAEALGELARLDQRHETTSSCVWLSALASLSGLLPQPIPRRVALPTIPLVLERLNRRRKRRLRGQGL